MKSLFSHRGAAAVEFALVLIPLIILTFGLIEFGLLMYNQQVLTNAAREGARRGIVQQTPRINIAEIENTVHTYADTHLVTFGGSAIPTITVPATCNAFGR